MIRRFLLCGLLCCCALLTPLATAGTASPDAGGKPPVWLVLGDSLSAAYGIAQSQGWVTLLQQRLSERGYRAQVINASVSGETTSGGLARLPALLAEHHPQIVLIELGGNDGLRALPIARLRDNLHQLVALSKKAGAKPVLFEMMLPPNYGPDYVAQFTQSFHLVAQQTGTPLVPFLLAPIVSDRAAFQADGIHPVAASQPKVLDAVWPSLEKFAK
jgi:acyl-CoA thioesterase-1